MAQNRGHLGRSTKTLTHGRLRLDRIHPNSCVLAVTVSEPDKVRVVAWAVLHPPLVFAFQSTELLREMQIPDAFHSERVPRAEILGDGQKPGESSSTLWPNLHASDIKAEINVIVDSMPTTTQVHVDAPIPEASVDVQPLGRLCRPR